MSPNTSNDHIATATEASVPMTYKLGDVVKMNSEWGGKYYLIVAIKTDEGKYSGVLLRGNALAIFGDENIEKKLAVEELEILAGGGDEPFYADGEPVWF